MAITSTPLFDLSKANTTTLKDAAVFYASKNFRVFPLEPGGKRPFAGFPWKDAATSDHDTVTRWWDQAPDANIGIVCGEQFCVLDLDRKKGQDGWESWRAIGGADPDQPLQFTPNKGYHILLPPDPEYRNFTRKGEHGGLDFRGANGYFVAAPSRINGAQYQWRDGLLAEPSSPIKERLLEWSHETRNRSAEVGIPTPENLSEEEALLWVDMMPEKAARFLVHGDTSRLDGDRSAAAYWAIRYLLESGWPLERLAAVLPYCDPLLGMAEQHTGGNPWHWLWKYTVSAAWNAHQTDVRSRQDAFAALHNTDEGSGESGGENGESGVDESDERGVDESGGESDERGVDETPLRSFEQIEEALATRSEKLETFEQVSDLLMEIATLPNLDQLHLGLLADRIRGDGTPFGLTKGDIINKIKTLQRVVRKRQALAAVSRKRYEVYVRSQNKIYDTVTSKFIDLRAFILGLTRLPGNKGVGEIDLREQFLASVGANEHVPLVEAITWDPGLPSGLYETGEEERTRQWYNAWTPSTLPRQAGDPSPWLDHLRSLRIQGGRKAEEALLDYMAYSVQHPGRKINHSVLLGGAHGIGKDTLLYPWLRAIGYATREDPSAPANAKTISATELRSEFSPYLAHTKALVVQEIEKVAGTGDDGLAPKLKHFSAAPPNELRVRDLFISPYPIPNVVQLVGLTNKRDALRLEIGDRRWLALWCQKPSDKVDPVGAEKVKRLWMWMGAGGEQIVAEYLHTRDISNFHPKDRPLSTDWLGEMEDNSSDPVTSWAKDAAESGEPAWQWDIVAEDVIFGSCTMALQGAGGRMTKARMRAALFELGWQRRTIGRGKTPFWCVRGGAEQRESSWAFVRNMGASRYRMLVIKDHETQIEALI